MTDEAVRRRHPQVYSIAAHRGFADALVAGLVPRYSEPGLGLARLTLLLPSSRARRTVSEAFIRHAGESGEAGLLMPRMAVVGDLDLDEALGPLLDPLGADDIPPAVDPRRRLFALARLISEEMGEDAPKGATLLRLARETGATMDRLLVEDVGPEELLGEVVLSLVGDLSEHWRASLQLFARVQTRWLAFLQGEGLLDAAARRNRLFDRAAERWRTAPPATPIVAAGVTSAAPALARMLRVVSELEGGAVILPDFDLTLDAEVWDELGRAGNAPEPGDTPFARGDAVTHPQYHMKLLLNRMGVAREEVQPWHRRGLAAAPPERSHAIGALFLPPEASRSWASLPADKRRLTGVRIMQCANPEEEAQAVALLVRQALDEPEKRVAVVTPDRGLARRVVHHLARWNIEADDSAGRPLSHTAAGRAFLLAAEVLAEDAPAVSLMALLGHPLADGGMERGRWLTQLRRVERALRGPRIRPGLGPIAETVAGLRKDEDDALGEWWATVEAALGPLLAFADNETAELAAMIDAIAAACEALCGDRIWAREDGRSLAAFVEDLRLHARDAAFALSSRDVADVLRDAMEEIAVRPPYGGHGRVQVLGLLESRMNRADLVICAGLNEGVWPARSGVDALLAPPVLRALGVPGADFRIGLSAHDLAGALGAPEVVLSRAMRDDSGPAIPSRFLLRVQALLGDLLPRHEETQAVEWARAIARMPEAPPYPRPRPLPSAEQRKVDISATALDRLRGDPYQFYAQRILRLSELDSLDADPSAAWQGEVAHEILERWHRARLAGEAVDLQAVMEQVFEKRNIHPLMRGLWQPRLECALDWVADEVENAPDGREVASVEAWGSMEVDGVRVHGRADRIDRWPNGELAIVDYKTGSVPSAAMVEEGFALQLGLLGMIARAGGFEGVSGAPAAFEYWSLAKGRGDEFGVISSPIKRSSRERGVELEEFLPATEDYLTSAIATWITGNEPFTARLNPDLPNYGTYDQLMRLDEWLPHMDVEDDAL